MSPEEVEAAAVADNAPRKSLLDRVMERKTNLRYRWRNKHCSPGDKDWLERREIEDAARDDINRMTPLELLEAISDALEDEGT